MATKGKSKSARYRDRLRIENPDKYEDMLSQSARRSREHREKLRNEANKAHTSKKCMAKIATVREQARVRQQRYREKRKGRDDIQILKIKIPAAKTAWTPTGLNTRDSQELRREYWRERKQVQRKRIKGSAPQKARRIQEKDARSKQEKRQKNYEAKMKATPKKATPHGYASTSTFHNTVATCRKVLPSSPSKFACVIKALVGNASPEKKKALKAQGITITDTTSPKKQSAERRNRVKCIRKDAHKFVKRVETWKRKKSERKQRSKLVEEL